jgi:hypothetical protein
VFTRLADPNEGLLTAARVAAFEYQEAAGQPITRDALRARLGISNQLASDLLRQIRKPQGTRPVARRSQCRNSVRLSSLRSFSIVWRTRILVLLCGQVVVSLRRGCRPAGLDDQGSSEPFPSWLCGDEASFVG